MGWFGRRARVMDGALPFLSVDDAAYLRQVTADAFRRAGRDVVVHDDHLAAPEGDYGLWNVAALCHRTGPRRVWPQVVAFHVSQVLQPMPDPADLTVDELLDVVVLRLAAGERDERRAYATEVADGLLQVLVADFPGVLTTLADADVERVGYDRLLAAGRARLLAQPHRVEVTELEGGARLAMLTGESVHVASKLLVLPEVLPEVLGEVLPEVLPEVHGVRSPPDGVLVAVPDRHSLTLHVPVDATVVEALSRMAAVTATVWESAAGPVSPAVHWWHDGALTQVTRRAQDGRVRVEVHDELAAVLERLVRS